VLLLYHSVFLFLFFEKWQVGVVCEEGLVGQGKKERWSIFDS
jgi:hypothetical protein